MRKPRMNKKVIAERHKKLAKNMSASSALVLASHPEYIRNSDVHHPYRPDSNLYFMTGFEEPDSVFIFRPGLDPESVLFVRKKDKLKETWDGFRYGTELTKELFQVDACYHIEDFESVASKLLSEIETLYYKPLFNENFDRRMKGVMSGVSKNRVRNKSCGLTIQDSQFILSEMRLLKDDYAVEQMRKTCKISSKAHIEVMKAMKPGINERALHGVFVKSIMEQGAAREGYGSIMATGNNATTLHYVFNDTECKDGELFLTDAGSEYNYYSGDITRTYPVNGQFNGAQKQIYSSVLELQKELVSMVGPNTTFKQLNEKTSDFLTDLMIHEKLLKESKSQILEEQLYKKYYPHGVGHWLGLDVHDAGFYANEDGQSRGFKPGMCLTIEPGIYIPADDESAPEALRGIGIRIEDDILVTKNGNDNLTIDTPKEVSELEDVVGKM